MNDFAPFLSTKLKSPAKSEEVNKLSNTQQAQACTKTNQSPKGSDEIFNREDNILIVLNNALVFKVDMQERKVLLSKILNTTGIRCKFWQFQEIIKPGSLSPLSVSS